MSMKQNLKGMRKYGATTLVKSDKNRGIWKEDPIWREFPRGIGRANHSFPLILMDSWATENTKVGYVCKAIIYISQSDT